MKNKEKKVLFIVGPTNSGKTELAFLIAKNLNTEILSADSRQIYKELNVGTAKPSENYLNQIKHHFVNNISVENDYNVATFVRDAIEIINGLFNKNLIPIVAGGTGLYINSLIYGIFEGPGKNQEIRNQLEKELNEFGLEYLVKKLNELDAETALLIDKNNSRRVIRALEVFLLTGKSIKKFQQEQNNEPLFKNTIIGLKWDRNKLYSRIEKRVDEMINNGLIEEAKDLFSKYNEQKPTSLQTVGYQELFDYFNSLISLDDAVELIKRNTRRYAKRQITWFRTNKDIIWIEMNENVDLEVLAKIITQDLIKR